MSTVNIAVREGGSESNDKTDEQRLWKVLGKKGMAHHGGTGSWPLPKGDRPGKWLRVEGELRPCRNGLHLCRDQDLLIWLGPAIWWAEAKGEQIDHGDKMVVREARLIAPTPWNERIARLFAADCAEHVLHHFEEYHPGDDRPRRAIETARRFANGKASREELRTAYAAADRAAYSARDIVVCCAAYSAAHSASINQSHAAASNAAHNGATSLVQRRWQTERLIAYLTGTAGA